MALKARRGPKPSINIFPGLRLGKLTIVRRMRAKKDEHRTMWMCRCNCGTEKEIPTQFLTRKENPARNCGAKACKYEDANPYPREKGIWHMMHQRTENPDHVSYKHYGARGIRVCDAWNKKNPQGWENFIAFIGPAPSTDHSIDRVDPNLGYQPFQADGVTRQVRWATAKEQANNQRRHHEP